MQLIEQLCCKPESNKVAVYESKTAIGRVSFTSLNLEKDLQVIHQWVNQKYAEEFWQMQGSLPLLKTCYYNLLQNPFAHSFTAWLDSTMVAQVDVYQAGQDAIAPFVKNLDNGDSGFHLLMAPNHQPIRGLTIAIVKSFLLYYFSFEAAKRMFAEPDIYNIRSQRILEKLHFEKKQEIDLLYKKAFLYELTKSRFLSFH